MSTRARADHRLRSHLSRSDRGSATSSERPREHRLRIAVEPDEPDRAGRRRPDERDRAHRPGGASEPGARRGPSRSTMGRRGRGRSASRSSSSRPGPRLGAGLVEDAVDDAAVLHVAGEEAERQCRRLGPASPRCGRRMAGRLGQQHVALAGRAERAHAAERLGVEVRDAELELERRRARARSAAS